MNKQLQLVLASLIFSIAISPFSFGHHSDVGIDETKVVVLEGKVTEFRWRQPHVYLEVDAVENGKTVAWDIQLVAINVLSRQGWSRDSLKQGDDVIVRAYPAENGRAHGKLQSILRADGSPVAVNPEQAEVALVPAKSMDGKWSGRNPSQALNYNAPPPAVDNEEESEDPICSGGFDCFFIQNLALTDAAKAARAAYDPLSSENPETTCVGRPTPAALVSSRGYLQEWNLAEQEEKILIRSEWFNELRTVWMDGRSHPPASQTFATGHSVGQWVGSTVVIDTRNFDNHRSPYQIGVPSGPQKHVIERYTLSEDGTYMDVEFILEDPEFIGRPLIRASRLYHSPHMQMYASDCDPDNTSRFAE